MEYYVPNKNNYEDCLLVIAIAKLNAVNEYDKVYVLKEIPFYNKIKHYYYTHIFHEYFEFRTCEYIKYDKEIHKGNEFLRMIYENIDEREILFTQEQVFENKRLINRHHFNLIRKKFPEIQLDFPVSQILMTLIREVKLKNFEEFEKQLDIEDITDRIGVCVCFDSFDSIAPDNDYILSYLKSIKNEKLYIISDDLSKIPEIDKTNDIKYFDTNILRVFGKKSSVEENVHVLKNILQASYNVCQCRELHCTNSDFGKIFLNFLRIKYKKPSVIYDKK